MPVLNLVSSPRGERSASIAIADGFSEALRALHPDVGVDTLDVRAEESPEFDQRASSADYRSLSSRLPGPSRLPGLPTDSAWTLERDDASAATERRQLRSELEHR